eukprot:UN13457
MREAAVELDVSCTTLDTEGALSPRNGHYIAVTSSKSKRLPGSSKSKDKEPMLGRDRLGNSPSLISMSHGTPHLFDGPSEVSEYSIKPPRYSPRDTDSNSYFLT